MNIPLPAATTKPAARQDTGPLKIFHPAEFGANLAFIQRSQSCLKTSLAECDLIIFPELLHARKDTEKMLREISEQYKTCHRKVLVFVLNDYEERYRPHDNLIVARTSVRASKLRANEIVLPYVWESPAGTFSPSAPTSLPQVGFCGLVSKHRKALIKAFTQSLEVRCDLIIRDKFWGGNPHDPKLVEDYYRNLERNQYILCNRGAGNFSIRFYQTLASRRIPVLVNTDLSLPFQDRIPWHELIVLGKNEKDCLSRVLEIHQSKKYLEMQNRCQDTFDRFFSTRQYFDRLAEELRENHLPRRQI